MLWAFWWWCKRVAAKALIQGVITFPGDGGKTWIVINKINNDLLCSQKSFIKWSNKLNILTFLSALFLDTDILSNSFSIFSPKIHCELF